MLQKLWQGEERKSRKNNRVLSSTYHATPYNVCFETNESSRNVIIISTVSSAAAQLANTTCLGAFPVMGLWFKQGLPSRQLMIVDTCWMSELLLSFSLRLPNVLTHSRSFQACTFPNFDVFGNNYGSTGFHANGWALDASIDHCFMIYNYNKVRFEIPRSPKSAGNTRNIPSMPAATRFVAA